MTHSSKLHKSAFYKTLDAQWDNPLQEPHQGRSSGYAPDSQKNKSSRDRQGITTSENQRGSLGMLAHLTSGLRLAANTPSAQDSGQNASNSKGHPAAPILESAMGMLRSAEGALEEISALLDRMRQIALLSSETHSEDERAILDEEFQLLRSEIFLITELTEFAGQKVLDAPSSAALSLLAARDSLIAAHPKDSRLRRVARLASRDDRNASRTHASLSGSAISSPSQAHECARMLNHELARALSERKSVAAVHARLEVVETNLRSAPGASNGCPHESPAICQSSDSARKGPQSETKSLLGLGTELVVPKAG